MARNGDGDCTELGKINEVGMLKTHNFNNRDRIFGNRKHNLHFGVLLPTNRLPTGKTGQNISRMTEDYLTSRKCTVFIH